MLRSIGFDRSRLKIPIIDLASITYLPETRSKSESNFVTSLTNAFTLSMEFKEILTLFFNEMGTEGKYLKWNYNLVLPLVSFLEKVYKLFRIKKEPPITKYTLYLMRYSQTLNIGKARKELGYSPKMSILEGVKNYVEHSKKNDRKS